MKSDRLSHLRRASAALLRRGEVDAIAEYFSPAYVVHVTGRDLSGGHPLLRQVVAMYRTAFSGITIKVEILAEEGDRVSWQRTLRGMHRGPFQGFPPSNRRIDWREAITSRFEGNLIVEEWFITDLAEQLLLARKGARARSGRSSR